MKDSSYALRRNRNGAAVCAFAMFWWISLAAFLTQERSFAEFRPVDWRTFYAFLVAEAVTVVFLVLFSVRAFRLSRIVRAERNARLTGALTLEGFDRETENAICRCFGVVGKKGLLDAVYVVRRIRSEQDSVSVFYLLFRPGTSEPERQKIRDRVSRRLNDLPGLCFRLQDAEQCEEFSGISGMEGSRIWHREEDAAVL